MAMTAPKKPAKRVRKPKAKKPTFAKPAWAVRQLVRETGLVEDVCEHGVGHPNAEWLAMRNARSERRIAGVHGCDGCCSKEAKKPSNVAEWEYHAPRKWGFWKRVWVSLFGA